MFFSLTLAAALLSGQAQSLGAVEAVRPDTAPPAPASAPVAPGDQQAAAPRRDQMVCTSQQVTGTRFPVRRCRSAAQAEAERAEAREMARRLQGSRTEPVG